MLSPSEIASLDLSRVNVIGVSGSGKSTFARRLSDLLDSKLFEMDQLYWRPNWEEAKPEVMAQLVNDATQHERWVLDGNYHSKTHSIKWQRATTVIWLDYSFACTLRRAVGRAFNRAWTKKELWPGTGNRETFRKLFFSHDSIVLWTITSFSRVRKRYEACMSDPKFEHLQFVRLRNPKDAEQILTVLSANGTQT